MRLLLNKFLETLPVLLQRGALGSASASLLMNLIDRSLDEYVGYQLILHWWIVQ